MLTPQFEISQTDEEVTIIIHAPYANIKDTEIHVDEFDFRFYSTPYYLRLNLPGKIEENAASQGDYDCEEGNFTLKFSKLNKGEYFENLDMITTLLAPSKKKTNLVPKIEVISNPCANDDEEINENEGESNNVGDVGSEWYINQISATENIQISLNSPKYGFANRISGALTAFEEAWIKEIIDLKLPDKTPLEDRKKLREQNEVENFCEDHYMADLMDNEGNEIYISFQSSEWEADVFFTSEEKDLLKELPNKEYLLDENDVEIALYSLVDILFADCYNYRTTLNENTVESAWTINKISSTLCWFQSFTNMNDVIISGIRRSLCYPLIRNWDLSIKIFEDVKRAVKLGKKYIIKRFCAIHSLFNNSYEPRYILNELYIKDYLIWLQKLPNSKIDELNSLLENINPSKKDIGLELEEIEEAAYSVAKEDLVIENELHALPDDLAKLIIDNGYVNSNAGLLLLKSDSDSDSDSDDSLSTSSTSTSSSSTNSSSSTSSSSSSTSLSTHSDNNILDSDDE